MGGRSGFAAPAELSSRGAGIAETEKEEVWRPVAESRQ
jgi:hypothetical protein